MKRTAVILAAIFTAQAVLAGVGTTAIDVLKVPSGIRSQAMGGAYTALSDGLEALDINPAGLAAIERQDVMFVHNIYLDDVFYDSAYYAVGLEGAGTIGVAGKFLSAGAVDETLENPDGSFGGETGNQAGGMNYLAAVAYGTNVGKLFYGEFTKDLNAGVALKLSGQSLGADYSDMGVSADIGAIYTIRLEEEDFLSNRGQFLWNRIGIGLALRNLGTSFGAGITPVTFSLGAYTQMLNAGAAGNRIRVSADFDYGIDSGVSVKGGFEYMHGFGDFSLSLRAGGNLNMEESLSGGFAAGAGFGMKTGQVSYALDYVFMPYSEFGSGHKFGLYVKF